MRKHLIINHTPIHTRTFSSCYHRTPWSCSALLCVFLKRFSYLENTKCSLSFTFAGTFRGIRTEKEFKSWLHLVLPLHHISSTKQQDRKHWMEKVFQSVCTHRPSRKPELITALSTETTAAVDGAWVNFPTSDYIIFHHHKVMSHCCKVYTP